MFQLTEEQQKIINSPARVKLVMGGARSGKTILAIMNLWEEMKRRNSPKFKVLFLVDRDNLARYSIREINSLLPIISVTKHEKYNCTALKTEFGEIWVSTQLVPLQFENITVDNATSNKHVNLDLLKAWSNIYITGHLPSDMNNTFFRWWLKEYFSRSTEVVAFRISENFMSSDIYKEQLLISSMGINRYNREYCSIPDYVEYDSEQRRQQEFRQEYFAEFTDKIDNSQISFNFKGPCFMGFDKAKE